MRGRTRTAWWGLVLDAQHPRPLAEFYAAVLGWQILKEDPTWIGLAPDESGPYYLAVQEAPDYEPPTWPNADGAQQMMAHLDIAVDDLDEAVDAAVELGATLAGHQPQDDVRVLLDPAGHPFCLYVDRGAAGTKSN